MKGWKKKTNKKKRLGASKLIIIFLKLQCTLYNSYLAIL